MTTHKSTWKKFERRVARKLGARRTPLSGKHSGHTRSDTLHRDIFVEAKKWSGRLLLKKHRDAFEETVERAEKEGKIPLYIFGRKYKPDEDALVVTRLGDLLKLLKERGIIKPESRGGEPAGGDDNERKGQVWQ